MAGSVNVSKTRGSKRLYLPTIVLAFILVRKTRGLLLITCLGFVAAVMFACAVPLYSNISMTAALRGALSSPSAKTDIVVQSFAEQINQSKIDGATNILNKELDDKLGPYLGSSQFTILTSVLPIYTKYLSPNGKATFLETDNQLQLLGTSMSQSASHLTLLHGRLPKTVSLGATNDDLEIALSAESARSLKAALGSTIYMKVALVYIPIIRKEYILPFRLVGIFKLPQPGEAIWHGYNFISSARGIPPLGPPGRNYMGLISDEPFVSIMTHITKYQGVGAVVLEIPFTLNWYYSFNPARISINDLATLGSNANAVQIDVANNVNLDQTPFLEKTQAFIPSDTLTQYTNRISIARLPTISILIIILGLVLFFISLMAELLVERQADTIAIVRSRGASRNQVSGSLVAQSILLALVALILGPLLAILMVWLTAQHVLSVDDQSALSIISGNPIHVILGIIWYPLITIFIAIVAMIISVRRTAHQDVLSIRREAARSTRLPLWQRLNLDIVTAIIMIVGYIFSYYVINAGILDPHLTLQLLAPLTLAGAVFLLIACLLLFLRFFPYLLQFGSWIAARSRKASPMLALAQMSRSPRQSVRLILLLALATVFTIFTITLIASQTQRIEDVAAYQSGADFSGTFVNSVATPLQVAERTTIYHQIPGVISATVGNISSVTAAGSLLSLPMEVRAVDSSTFAQTAIWTRQDSSQPLTSIMSQLTALRARALSRLTVPAVVDSAAWQSLQLTSTSPTFSLNFTNGNVHFIAIAEVDHIPTVNDVSTSITSSGSVPNGGILVDYPSLASVYGYDFKASSASFPVNAVWLRTRDDAASLASVRSTLTSGVLELNPLYDRRAAIESLYHDPLYLDLIGILILGAVTALLLALVGNLIATRLNAKKRLVNFAVLRALGASSPQIASTLAWEQSIVYTAAILLGILFGAVFSAFAVPRLIFTSVALSSASVDLTSNQFYVTQSVPPIQIVVPPLLIFVLIALVIICFVALGMMIRIVSRPSISQTLRLNED